MLSEAQFWLLARVKHAGTLSVMDLTPSERRTLAGLQARGMVTLKSTLNTCKAKITRLGVEQLQWQQAAMPDADACYMRIKQEVARLRLRATLQLTHRFEEQAP